MQASLIKTVWLPSGCCSVRSFRSLQKTRSMFEIKWSYEVRGTFVGAPRFGLLTRETWAALYLILFIVAFHSFLTFSLLFYSFFRVVQLWIGVIFAFTRKCIEFLWMQYPKFKLSPRLKSLIFPIFCSSLVVEIWISPPSYIRGRWIVKRGQNRFVSRRLFGKVWFMTCPFY